MVQPLRGLVLHIEQGSETGTDAWFHNPTAQASAHFGNPKVGPLDQWVDTKDKAWAIVAGNRYWISVENEGFSGDSLTTSQIQNCGELLAWLHLNESVPLQMANHPDKKGLGYHAMGGESWGGHLHCPGKPIVDQRQLIIQNAKRIVDARKSSELGHPPLAIMAEKIAAAAKEAATSSP